jgi:hypothetical protein
MAAGDGCAAYDALLAVHHSIIAVAPSGSSTHRHTVWRHCGLLDCGPGGAALEQPQQTGCHLCQVEQPFLVCIRTKSSGTARPRGRAPFAVLGLSFAIHSAAFRTW